MAANECRSRFGEKLGYFVFLTSVFANLAYIVLVRVPMVHADLNGAGFLFGGSVCKAVQVLYEWPISVLINQFCCIFRFA